ncbi:uncharacterized protein [Nicotiana sylvestris]|uniref:uncharacterized protein n=1 Tax=Nicotiana sylvestris TaxID=4096 RepID=UPI00388C3EB6
MSLEDLIVRLRIEEDNKVADKRDSGNSTIMRANIVEENKKRKKTSGPKYNPSKKRFSGNYYNCGKTGYKSTECRAPKKDKKKGQANMVEKHDNVDDLEAFATYAPVRPDETLSMGNAAKAKIEGYIACAISKLSRYTSNPGQSHWMAMKQVLGYLVHPQDFALHYSKYPAVIEGYCDANWITGSTDSKSTSGYVFTIDG